jgi:acylphosphatase
MKTLHYIVKGSVQGVAFRHYTVIEAEKFGIRGTVKNLDNGDVEVYAQAEGAGIERFEAFLRRGPYMARVNEVIREEVDDVRTFPFFDVEF